MDRDTFFRHLRLSGLLREHEIEAASRLASSDRARGIARALVEEGLLTRFQARRVLAGKPSRLLLGQYRILDPLGKGATGRVFRAVHTSMNRVVAIKVIRPGILKDPATVDFFNREVRAAAQLTHPNIVTAYDADEVKGRRFLVMEYVDGPSLHDLVKGGGRLPIDTACELMSQAAAALQYAHEKGVVHRDIKPANLLIAGLVGTEGRPARSDAGPRPLVKVADFGLARLRDDGISTMVDTIMVEPGAVLGTVDYISPEQAHDIHAADIRSDLYSLGCVFYYALTGRVPFPGGNSLEKLFKQLTCEPQPLRELRPEVPPALEAIVRRLMAKERDQRFQTPAGLAAELAALSGSCARLELAAADVAGPSEGPPTAGPAADTDGHGAPEVTDGLQETSCPLADSAVPVPPIDKAFQARFRQWTAIVERSLRRPGALRRMNRETFSALHRSLVTACEVQANAAQGQRRDFFRGLADLLKPWLSPDAIVQTDIEIRYQLVHLFQQAEQELNRWARASRSAESDQTSLGRLLNRFKQWGRNTT
jgi:serine/threonine-protein kinase